MSGDGASARGVKQVGYFDCPGGGQVVVDGRVAFIAHMKAPHGTTLVDVSDPAKPRQLASIEVPPGTHSHKVRAANGLMLVNREAHGGRRDALVDRPATPLPSPDSPGQPALRQLLAWRLRYPRRGRPREAALRLGARLEPAVPDADAHGAARAVSVAWTARHAGGRRGCGEARARAAGVSLARGPRARGPHPRARVMPGAPESHRIAAEALNGR